MRLHHLLAAVIFLAMAMTGVDVALSSLAAPMASPASHSAPPVAPLLFGGD